VELLDLASSDLASSGLASSGLASSGLASSGGESLAEAAQHLMNNLREAPEFQVGPVPAAVVPGTKADGASTIELFSIGLWSAYQISRTAAAHKLVEILANWAESHGKRWRIKAGHVEIEGQNVSGREMGEIARCLGPAGVDLRDPSEPTTASKKRR
jgi:hypothetical protein